MSTTSYNDGAVPTGGFVVSLFSGATNRGSYILESITPSRPTKKTLRSDEQGGPNGFRAVNEQETASGVIQIATAGTYFPQRGDFFSVTADPTIGSEKWVIVDFTQPFEAGVYYKQNISLLKTYLS